MTRRFLQVVALMCTLAVGAAAMALIVTQTAWFKEWLRRLVVRQAQNYVNGDLTIGRLDGNLLFGLELENVGVTMDGMQVVAIKDVGLDYSVLTFLNGDVVLDDIRLNQPVFRIQRTDDGWNITRLMRARTPDATRGRRPIAIGEIGISDGTLYVDGGPVGTTGVVVPERIERLDASLGITSDEEALTVDIGHVSLRAEGPKLDVNALSGTIRRTDEGVTFDNVSLRTAESSVRVHGRLQGNRTEGDDARTLDVSASSDKLDIAEFAEILPVLRGYGLQPALEVTARGPLDRMAVDLNVRDANLGQVTGDLLVDASSPARRLSGQLSLSHFNMAPIIAARSRGTAVTSDVTGEATIDLLLPSRGEPLRGTYVLEASRARVAEYEARNVVARGRIDGRLVRVNGVANAYGGRASAAGTVAFGRPVALDLTGRASNVDLRNLPAVLRMPAAPSRLQFDYTLHGRQGVYSGDVRFDASMLAGASIEPGTTGQFRFGGGAPAYAAQGQVVNLDVQQIGQGFDIRALETDRWRSRIGGTFDVKGAGGGRYPLVLEAAGEVADSEILGARLPRLEFTAQFGEGDAHVRTVGEFENLDPAVVTGNPRVAGDFTGSVDAQTTFRDYASGITIDSFDVAGSVMLERSSVHDISIDRAVVEGTYERRQGQLSLFEVMGPDLNARGEGTLALNDTGASNLVVHLETPSLQRIGEIVSRPLTGGAIVDATITGNAADLKAEGTLQGSNIGYGDSRALTLSSMFTASVPALALEDASVQAKSTATFLEVEGQSIRQLDADTTYSQGRLEFDGVAQEGVRELAVAGSAVFHPDHQEVHVTNLALRAEQVEWRTVPGSDASIRYGGDGLGIEGLRLVSGDQRIDAEGVLGSPDGVLKVRAENVDVAQLDRLTLGDQRLAGRLNANAVISGPLDAPRAEGQFALTQGAFQKFTFQSLAGTVDYIGSGIKVDVRLDQSPQAWLTAKGYAPLSLFQPNPPDAEGHETAAEGDGIDLQVESTEVDLGVVQGFTSYVTEVTGVLQTNVKVTGTGHDPHFEGVVDIRGGAFSVPSLGTAYTGLDTRVDLSPDAVTISEMRIVDEHQQVMTVGGKLAVHEREVGAVNVEVRSENFEMIDNELADLKLDTDVRITGELRAPRVEGFVELESGTVDVARLLEQTTGDPYATEATVLEEVAPAESTPEEPTLFDALDLNLGVAVPSNLVLNGTDLRPVNAPIDIGDMNVTVGGAVQLRKAPGERARIVGEMNTIRGSYTFQGRRFEILRDGRIRFAGTEEIDPVVDLRARRIISGVETFVRVQGTMREPELAFSSSPPLDQAEILSLIVFNMPINELGEGQQISLAERAGALAGGYVVSGLTRSLANALELDEFEIQAQGERSLGPSLSIGEQVGEKLFFRIRQGFGAAEATEFILEYQIADYLRLQGAVAETSSGSQRVTFRRIERAGLDLIFFFSY